MFDQTFVDGVSKTKKPATVLLSLVLQIGAICIAILIPLLFTEALPSAQLKSTLVAPAPPVAPPQEKFVPQTKVSARVFNVEKLFTPRVIPNRVNAVDDAGAAPNVGVVGSTGGPPQGVIGDILGGLNGSAPPPLPSPTPPAIKRDAKGPVRVGGGVAEANLIHRVQPLYPALAKSARVQGTVEFTATISKQGTIENLQLVRGHPLLVNAARDAVLQWRYRPTLLNGEPVEVLTDILVNFTLSQ